MATKLKLSNLAQEVKDFILDNAQLMLDSSEVTALINNAYVQARQITYSTADFPDSAGTTTLAKAAISVTDAGGAGSLSYSNGVITYTGPTVGNDFVDSAEVIKLIDATFDSDNTIALIDSDYVTERSYAHHYYVKAAEAISVGEVVMFGGVQGDHILAKVCDPSAVGFIPEWVMGVANTSIATNDWGRVTAIGRLEGVDTSSFSNGDLLYMDPSTAGALTTTKPSPSDHIILVCAVLKASAGASGIIQVRLSHEPDTDEVPEGSSNLYYTTARADSDARNAISVSTSGEGSLTYNSTTGVITYAGPTTANFVDSAYVTTQINNLIDGAPGTLDTLNEIAAALNDDDSAYGTLVTLINNKDSDFVKSAITASYIQSNQTTYNTSDFADSAYVQSVLPSYGNDYVDSAFVSGKSIALSIALG